MNTAQLIFIIVFTFALSACTTAGHHYIDINPPPFGAEAVPAQLNTLLKKSGFKRIEFSQRISDPNAGATDALNMKTGMVLETSNKLFMRYQHQSKHNFLINVIIGREKGEVELEFYEVDKNELSSENTLIYNNFKENLKSFLYNEKDFSER